MCAIIICKIWIHILEQQLVQFAKKVWDDNFYNLQKYCQVRQIANKLFGTTLCTINIVIDKNNFRNDNCGFRVIYLVELWNIHKVSITCSSIWGSKQSQKGTLQNNVCVFVCLYNCVKLGKTMIKDIALSSIKKICRFCVFFLV